MTSHFIRNLALISLVVIGCGESEPRSSNVSGNNSFKNSGQSTQDSSKPGTMKTEVDRNFDKKMEANEANPPTNAAKDIQGATHSIKDILFFDPGETTVLSLPADYTCKAGSGTWTHEGSLTASLNSTECKAEISLSQSLGEALESNAVVGRVIFSGAVKQAGAPGDVDLTYEVEVRRAVKLDTLPAHQALAGLNVEKKVQVITDESQAGESSSATKLRALSQDFKSIPLGNIAAFSNTKDEENSSFFVLPKEVDDGDVVWSFQLPVISGQWDMDSLANQACDILHNKSVFGFPDVQDDLPLYEDADLDDADGIHCPLQLEEIDFPNNLVKLRLLTQKIESLDNRYALKGLSNYQLEPGKNNILRYSFTLKYSSGNEDTQVLLEYPLRLSSLEQPRVKLDRYEKLELNSACQFYVSRAALPIGHPIVTDSMKGAQSFVGSDFTVRSLIIENEDQNSIFADQLTLHFGRRQNFWINLFKEDSSWGVHLDELKADPNRVDPPFENWAQGGSPNRNNRNCAFVHGNHKREHLRNTHMDVNCLRARHRHIIEICPNGDSSELPIGVLE